MSNPASSYAFEERAKKDLESIFQQLNSGRFVRNKGFSDKLNKDLDEAIQSDKKHNTKTVIRLSSWQKAKVKKPFLSSGKIKIIISGIGDSYWIVDGQESAIPGEIETSRIRKQAEAEYELTYEMDENNNSILIDFTDDNGYQLGALNTPSETPKDRPILHAHLTKNHYKIAFLLGFIYNFLSIWGSPHFESYLPRQWITLLVIFSIMGAFGYLNFIAVDVLRVMLKERGITRFYLSIFSLWLVMFIFVANPLALLTLPFFLILGKIFIK